MTDRQLRDEMMTLLIAGHETVASALAWTWHLLATLPRPRRSSTPSWPRSWAAARRKWTICRTCVTLRRFSRRRSGSTHPPGSSPARRWRTTNRRLPHPGERAGCCQPVRHPPPAAFWADPEAFIPERSSAEALPAGRGSPSTRSAAAHGLHRRPVRHDRGEADHRERGAALPPGSVPGHPVEVEPGVTLRPRHGLMMTLEKRRPLRDEQAQTDPTQRPFSPACAPSVCRPGDGTFTWLGSRAGFAQRRMPKFAFQARFKDDFEAEPCPSFSGKR